MLDVSEAEGGNPIDESRPRVLIVDDEQDFTTATKLALENAGMEALVAENGLRAIEEIEIFQPDVVILDIYMPVMDGVKVCKFIRVEKQNATLPIVAITAYGDETKKEEVLAAGANLYLTKPIDPVELLDHVRSFLGGEGPRQ